MPYARDTGFSPYEIVYGRKFPSPLSLLFDSWSDTQAPPVKLCAWLELFDKRVEAIRDSVRDKLTAVQQRNSELQSTKLLRTFDVGDSVLLRACGLPDKLAHAWCPDTTPLQPGQPTAAGPAQPLSP